MDRMAGKIGLDSECFFITPIGADGSDIRRRSDGVLKFIVGRASAELGLTAVRADEIAEPGLITRQVIDHVLGAKAAVADLTGLNANVFYEMAVRHAAKLPVVLIAETGMVLPFDIAQMRTIFFDHTDLDSADKCRVEIVKHLREAIDNGAVDSPIATTLDVQALQAGSAVERNVAELVTAFESISRVQTRMASAIDELTERRSSSPGQADDLRRLDSLWTRYRDVMNYVKRTNAADERLSYRLDRLGDVVGDLVRKHLLQDPDANLDRWLDTLDSSEVEVVAESPREERTIVAFI
jgi:hypothetical protein